MTAESPIRSFAPLRREKLRLPRRRTHVILAVLFVGLVVAIPLLLSKTFGDPSDANAKGTVLVQTLPPEDQPSPLDQAAGTLPDLLAGLIEDGENPTALGPTTDALGNPVNSTTTAPQTNPVDSSPTIITIPEPVAPPLNPTLTRSSRFGRIPGPNASGLTPLRAYAVDIPPVSDRQPVSLVIGGLGINAGLTERAIRELPATITLSFAAQSEDLQMWINKARAYGHEVYLEIPMQGDNDSINPSETDRALRATADAETNRRNLQYALSKAQGYAGVTHYQGQPVLQRADLTAPILDEIKKSGLGFFTDGAFATPSLTTLAETIDLPFRSGFGVIDPVADRAVIDERLQQLSETAIERPYIIGVGFTYPQTIDAVKGWAATLSDDNLILVPVSATLSP